ncbi:hypothetical protein PoB_000165900 [Plakobranchus ocellatus]|uniref:Uncharacterized protein n=1 Tax=Plakobranchus ocellatus TaxID=259542 RepID=A0AAV3XYY4_9GAST|nr:hypothetical protein PoB_000165900 [Plakobranchus ocellatus]
MQRCAVCSARPGLEKHTSASFTVNTLGRDNRMTSRSVGVRGNGSFCLGVYLILDSPPVELVGLLACLSLTPDLVLYLAPPAPGSTWPETETSRA